MEFTVAIDGPAAAGKGTIARDMAKRFGFAHLDTGLLYRAVGVKVLARARGVIDPVLAAMVADKLTEKDLKRQDLRSAMASRAASRVAAVPEVRAALLEFQRRFARREGGAVLDGRDIGTVICPAAEVKLFVTADATTRAQRRFEELVKGGADTTLQRVTLDLQTRDERDAAREVAPTTVAEDALVLDTTKMSIEDATAAAAEMIEARLALT